MVKMMNRLSTLFWTLKGKICSRRDTSDTRDKMLHELLPEILEKIFGYVPTADLKRLAICSRSYDVLVKEFMWKTLHMAEGQFALIDWEKKDKAKLKNLRYTKSVYIEVYKLDHYDDWSKHNKRKNFNIFFEHCKPSILYSSYYTKAVLNDYITKIEYLKELSMGCTDITDEDLLLICNTLTRLKVLRISRTVIGDDGIASIHLLEFLEVLEISGIRITRKGLECVARLNKLKDLYLSYCRHIVDEDFQILTRMALEYLRVYTSATGDLAMSYISNIKSLKFLDIGQTRITDNGLEHLAKLKNLRVLLTEYSTETITLRGLNMISRLSSLTKLVIIRNQNLTESTTLFSKLINLTELDLDGCTNLNPSSLEQFGKWNKLNKLVLSNTGLVGDSLSFLSTIVSLEHLNLRRNVGIADAGLKHLNQLQLLRKLDLESSRELTSRGVVHLVCLGKLEWLSVRHCCLDDESLGILSAMVSLKTLLLTANKDISDLGMEKLGTLSYLEEIDISDCTGVSLMGVRTLPPSLRLIRVSNTQVTREQIGELKVNKNLKVLKEY